MSLTLLLGMGLAAQPTLAQQQTSDASGEETVDWVAATMCAADNRSVELDQPLSFSFTDADGNNLRHLDATQAGLTTADLANLELAWRSLSRKLPVCVLRR